MYLPDLGEAFEEAYERTGVDPASLVFSHFTSARRSLAGLFLDLKAQGVAEHQIDYWSADIDLGEGAIVTPDDTVDITDLVLRYNGRDTPLARTSKERWLTISDKTHQGVPTEYWVSKEWSPDVGILLDDGAYAPSAYDFGLGVDPAERPGPFIVLYPVPEKVGYSLLGFRIRATEDKQKATDLLPVRQAWTEAIIAGLALRLYEKRGGELDQARLKVLQGRAESSLVNAKRSDRNRSPTVIAGNFRNWRTRRL